MNIHVWIRAKLFGPPDQTKHTVVKKIESEVSRLNGATQQLAEEVQAIKTDRVRHRQAFSEMLDQTIQALNKEKRL